MNDTATEQTPRQRAESVMAELGLTITSEFIPFSQSRNKAEKSPSLNWKVTLQRGRPTHSTIGGKPTGELKQVAILTTDYSAGCGHCPAYKLDVKHVGSARSIMRDKLIRDECETGRGAHYMEREYGKPLKPDATDVLYSLVMDSDVLDSGGFEEWAANYGYETDSRKAESIYRQCLELALKMRGALGEATLQKLREAFQDY